MGPQILRSKRFWVFAALASGIAGALIWVSSRTGGLESSAVLPSPNGYDDFVAAENELEGGLPDLSKVSADELNRILAEHASSLNKARQGLTRECRVPIDYSEAGLTNILDHLALAKTLGLLLREEGHAAEMNSDYSKALQCYADAVKFSWKRFHGGLVIHHLVAVALAQTAEARLESIIPKLNREDYRRGITALLEVEGGEEPIAEILNRDLQWGRSVSKMGDLQIMLMKLLPQFRKSIDAPALKVQNGTRSRRNLLLRLAARAYELETGKAPVNASELVPAHLSVVPKDPVTGVPLPLPK
jgi:hypothetical protein